VTRPELYPAPAAMEWEVDLDVTPGRDGHALRNRAGTYRCHGCGVALATCILTYDSSWTSKESPVGGTANVYAERVIGSATRGTSGLVNRGDKHRSGLAWYRARSVESSLRRPSTDEPLRLPVVASCRQGHDNLLETRHE